MSLVLLNRPLLDYIAVKNPCLYKFQRQDFTFSGLTDSAGSLQITASVNLTTLTTAQGGPVVVGSKIFVQSNDLVFYKKVFTVVSVSNAANSIVVFEAGSYVGVGSTSGILNLMQRYNYRAEIEVYQQTTNLLLGTVSYSPDKTGLIKADVSTIIKNVLSPDINTTTLSLSTWFQDNAITGFYIKYREVWSGSAEAQTNDSGNVRNGVYAANQITDSIGTNQLIYPSILGRINAVWQSSINVFTYLNNNTASLYLRITKDGLSSYIPIDQYTGLRSIAWKAFENFFFGQTTTADIDWTAINKSQWQVILTSGQVSEYAIQILRVESQINFELVYEVSKTGASSINIETAFYDESGAGLTSLNTVVSGAAGTQTIKLPIFITGIIKRIDTRINSVTANQTVTLKSSVSSFNNGDASAALVTTSPFIADTVTLTLPKIKIFDYCSNQFNIVWRNRFGGLSNFIFQFNQLFSWRFRDQYKAKEFVLYADSLTDDHIEQLEDLNQVGDIYSVPYDELPVNVTQKKTGVQAYKCETDGKLTGVIVNPTANSYKTLFTKSRSKITVELPETIN